MQPFQYTVSLLLTAVAGESVPMTEACHNCRRQRLKCDRTVPQCLKCGKRGQECLSYDRLYRWEKGVASRGKMAGMSFDQKAKVMSRPLQPQTLYVAPAALTDPLSKI
jgi:hypothetical protein